MSNGIFLDYDKLMSYLQELSYNGELEIEQYGDEATYTAYVDSCGSNSDLPYTVQIVFEGMAATIIIYAGDVLREANKKILHKTDKVDEEFCDVVQQCLTEYERVTFDHKNRLHYLRGPLKVFVEEMMMDDRYHVQLQAHSKGAPILVPSTDGVEEFLNQYWEKALIELRLEPKSRKGIFTMECKITRFETTLKVIEGNLLAKSLPRIMGSDQAKVHNIPPELYDTFDQFLKACVDTQMSHEEANLDLSSVIRYCQSAKEEGVMYKALSAQLQYKNGRLKRELENAACLSSEESFVPKGSGEGEFLLDGDDFDYPKIPGI